MCVGVCVCVCVCGGGCMSVSCVCVCVTKYPSAFYMAIVHVSVYYEVP